MRQRQADDAILHPSSKLSYPTIVEQEVSEDGYIVDWVIDWDFGVVWLEVKAKSLRGQVIEVMRG